MINEETEFITNEVDTDEDLSGLPEIEEETPEDQTEELKKEESDG